MKKLLDSKHRSLIFFLISASLIYFNYCYIKYALIVWEALDLINNGKIISVNYFITLMQPAIGLCISISINFCSVILITKDLKPYSEKGLISYLLSGLQIAPILGGLVGELIIYLFYKDKISIPFCIVSGLMLGMIFTLLAGTLNEFIKKPVSS